jgi:glyoxalase family protein
MKATIPGLHHVTAIASDARENREFYTDVLGLRMVKRTVNFDSPTTWHLYYGDGEGRPGSLLTFFPWGDLPRGRRGTGQATAVGLEVPEGSLEWWRRRLDDAGVAVCDPVERLGEPVLAFTDPHGLALELVGTGEAADAEPAWPDGPAPGEHAVRGVHGVTITVEGFERTADLLEETLGLRRTASEEPRFRFEARGSAGGRHLDVVCEPDTPQGQVAVGCVHHVAFRAPDPETQRHWRAEIVDRGYDVTPVLDRRYFRSIYFREPGGVLFEIATDPPGFTVDEDPGSLGRELQLPPRLEPRREELERALPPLEETGEARV